MYLRDSESIYTTRVGSGPFPSELSDFMGQRLGEIGNEFGTVTGDKDAVVGLRSVLVKHSLDISGADGIALTKLDVLDTFKEIKFVLDIN